MLGKRQNKHINKGHTQIYTNTHTHILTNTHELQKRKPGLDSWLYHLVQMTSVPLCEGLYNGHNATCPTYLCGFTVRLDCHEASKMLCK